MCARMKNLENALAPGFVAKKMLSHALSRHADAECSNATQGSSEESSLEILETVLEDGARTGLTKRKGSATVFLSFEG